MAILSGMCNRDNFQSRNSLKHIYQYSRSSLKFHFIKSNSHDILVLCETNLEDSIDFSNFPVMDYFSLIRKDSFTHMHLAVYMKE